MTSKFNQGVINELNALRTNPKRYANKIYNYTKYFKGNVLRLPGASTGITTEEGPKAYTEAGDFLGTQDRIEGLVPSKGLCGIAQDLLKQIQESDPNDLNVNMEEIIAKHGHFYGNFSRAIDYGGESPEQVLANLIVCDGDASRGQRDSLLSTDFKRVGVANGEHSMYGHCCVIVYCTQFENTKDKDDTIYEQCVKKTEGGDNAEEEDEEDDGEVLRPRKVMIGKRDDDEEEDQKEKGGEGENKKTEVVNVSQSTKIVVEGGKKKKITKITKTLANGMKEVETIKENVEE